MKRTTLGKYFGTTFEDGKLVLRQKQTDIEIATSIMVDALAYSDYTEEEWETIKEAIRILKKIDK